MRLVDSDFAINEIKEHKTMQTVSHFATAAECNAFRDGMELAAKIVNNCPTISAVPVVRGEWVQKHHIISLNNMTLTGTYPTCNLCDYAEVGMAKNTNYCPNCGAKMESEGST